MVDLMRSPFSRIKTYFFILKLIPEGRVETAMSVQSNVLDTSIDSREDSKSVPQSTVERESERVPTLRETTSEAHVPSKLPKGSGLVPTPFPSGSKVILPADKVTPAVKKERSEAQKEAFKKMRAARDESNKRRQFSRKEALEKIDEMKEEERKAEEEEAQRKAKELAEATGATVVVQKRRGRKPGEKIPYGGKGSVEPHPQGKGKGNPNLNIDAPSPSMSAIYSQPIEKQPHYKAEREPSVKAPTPIAQPIPTPVYENPYLEMIRRKRR